MIVPSLLFIAITLSSCSTLKDEDCQNRDWREQGNYDGAKGYTKEMYYTYLKVCEQTENKASLDQYLEGYQTGSKRYCTYNKGLLVGESGRPYPQVCPREEYPDFDKGFKKGKKKTLK